MARRPGEARKETRREGRLAGQRRRTGTCGRGGPPPLPPPPPSRKRSRWPRAPARPQPAAAGAAEWKGRSAAIGRQRGGRARIGQREGAGPPLGMYYGVSGTSVRSGRARKPSRARGGRAHGSEGRRTQTQRAAPVTCCARATRGPKAGARGRGVTRTRGWASWSGSRGGADSAFFPAPPPFPPSGFLSFLFFLLFFFSMNTHRVHLKATLSHFTASFGYSLTTPVPSAVQIGKEK